MAKPKNPLYVLVDANNVAHDTAETFADAQTKRVGDAQLYNIKLFSDHKGDKSRIGY